MTLRFLCLLLLCIASLAAEPAREASTGASLLEQISSAFTQVSKKATPAAVSIKVQHAPTLNHPSPFSDDLFLRRFFEPFAEPQEPESQFVGGSGFLIRPNGYIVTNHHVVRNGQQISVILNDGREFPAVVKGSDPRTDLAVLKIEEENLPYLSFGDSDHLEVGEWVVAIGNPFGLEATLTKGIVSAKGRQDLGIAAYEDFIQTDAAINPGNSGGPLLNLRGEVVGVNTAILTRTGSYAGIGLAIPGRMAESVAQQIIDGGAVRRAYLGVLLQPVDKELSAALKLDKQEGVLISEVMKDSPAKKGGLSQGDIILSYNDKPAKNVAKLRNEIALMTPGATLKLKLLRSKKPLALTIALGSHSDGEVITSEMSQKLGLELENLSPELTSKLNLPSEVEGVAITGVKPGSSSAAAGLRPGALIIGVVIDVENQQRVKNLDDLNKAVGSLEGKKHLILIVRHQNFQRFYTVRVQ